MNFRRLIVWSRSEWSERCLFMLFLRVSGLRVPHETVSHIARVNIVSGDRTDGIVAKRNSALARACACARNIKRGDGAVLSTLEAMTDIARVYVLTRHRPWRVDAPGY